MFALLKLETYAAKFTNAMICTFRLFVTQNFYSYFTLVSYILSLRGRKGASFPEICPVLFANRDIYFFFNRPGVAGAVLQTPPSLIKLLIQPFPPNHQNIITPKP